MSPVLEKVLQEMEQLTPEELLEAISSATDYLKRQAVKQNQVQGQWLELPENAPYPLTAEDARECATLAKPLGELLAKVSESGEQITIEKSGKPVAAIISYAELQRLQALEEDARDSEMMRRAVEEHDGEFVTLEDAIAKYNKLHGTDFTPESIIND